MRYKTLVAMAHLGSRFEKGVEIELTPEQANNYADAVERVGEAVPEPTVEEETPVTEMTVDELRAKAKALGLSAAGSKADLLERISLHVPEPTVEEEKS